MAAEDKDKHDGTEDSADLLGQVPGYAQFLISQPGPEANQQPAPQQIQQQIPQSNQQQIQQPNQQQIQPQWPGAQPVEQAPAETLEWKATPHEWLGGSNPGPTQPAWPGAELYAQTQGQQPQFGQQPQPGQQQAQPAQQQFQPGQQAQPGHSNLGPEGPEFIPQTPRYMNPPSYPDLPWKAGPGPTWAIFADNEHHRNPPQPQVDPKPVVPPGGSAANPLPVLPLPIGSVAEEDDEETLIGGPAARLAKLTGRNTGAGRSTNSGKIQNQHAQGEQDDGINEARGFRRPLGPGAFPESDEGSDSFISRRPFLSSGSAKVKSIGLSFSKSDIFGLATYNFMVTKDILFDPRIFFRDLALNGGFGEPMLFSIFACLLSSALFAVAKLNLLLFFWSFIVSFLSLTLGAVVVTWAFRKLGGKGNLEGTFRVLAFSKATVVFSWISLGAVPVGLLIAAAYTGYMNYVGLSRVHQLPRKQTIILVVVLSILGMLWRQGMP
jgi:hypothetical protein